MGWARRRSEAIMALPIGAVPGAIRPGPSITWDALLIVKFAGNRSCDRQTRLPVRCLSLREPRRGSLDRFREHLHLARSSSRETSSLGRFHHDDGPSSNMPLRDVLGLHYQPRALSEPERSRRPLSLAAGIRRDSPPCACSGISKASSNRRLYRRKARRPRGSARFIGIMRGRREAWSWHSSLPALSSR